MLKNIGNAMVKKINKTIILTLLSIMSVSATCYASSGNGDGFWDVSESEEEYSSGQYKVGTDIPEGEYILFSDSGKGYFCVSSDSNADDIIFNDNFKYNSIITINDGEYLELSRCYAVSFDEVEELSTKEIGSMYKVGVHIPSGEYQLDANDDRGYYCIYSDSRHDDIIANDNFEGKCYVTVTDGQYLLLSRCGFVNPPTPISSKKTSKDNNESEEASFFEDMDLPTIESVFPDCPSYESEDEYYIYRLEDEDTCGTLFAGYILYLEKIGYEMNKVNDNIYVADKQYYIAVGEDNEGCFIMVTQP